MNLTILQRKLLKLLRRYFLILMVLAAFILTVAISFALKDTMFREWPIRIFPAVPAFAVAFYFFSRYHANKYKDIAIAVMLKLRDVDIASYIDSSNKSLIIAPNLEKLKKELIEAMEALDIIYGFKYDLSTMNSNYFEGRFKSRVKMEFIDSGFINLHKSIEGTIDLISEIMLTYKKLGSGYATYINNIRIIREEFFNYCNSNNIFIQRGAVDSYLFEAMAIYTVKYHNKINRHRSQTDDVYGQIYFCMLNESKILMLIRGVQFYISNLCRRIASKYNGISINMPAFINYDIISQLHSEILQSHHVLSDDLESCNRFLMDNLNLTLEEFHIKCLADKTSDVNLKN